MTVMFTFRFGEYDFLICLLFLFQVRNQRSCKQSCRDTSGCRFWMHVSRSEPNRRLQNACYLMSDKAGQAPNEHRTSGEIGCNQGNGNNGGSGSKNIFS